MEEFSLNNKICADLNFDAINLKFSYIVDTYVTFIQIDSIKIKAWGTHEEKEILWNKKIHADLNL